MIFPVPVEESYPGGRYTLRGQYPMETTHTFYLAAKGNLDDFFFCKEPAFGPEEYTLTVDDKGIAVIYSTEAGRTLHPLPGARY